MDGFTFVILGARYVNVAVFDDWLPTLIEMDTLPPIEGGNVHEAKVSFLKMIEQLRPPTVIVAFKRAGEPNPVPVKVRVSPPRVDPFPAATNTELITGE